LSQVYYALVYTNYNGNSSLKDTFLNLLDLLFIIIDYLTL